MSRESLEWLNTNTLIGFTDQRGNAWHYRADLQADQPNHYPGAIPVGDVTSRLFHWTPLACPVYAKDPTSDGLITAARHKALVRSDTHKVLGIVGADYEPHLYGEWLVEKVATLLDDDLAIGSAGLLRGGAVAWVSVEVPETVTTPEGVAFRPHLLAASSLDGTMATTWKRVVTAVVCDNTMAAGLAENGQQVRVKHTKRSKLHLLKARDALNIIYRAGDEFADEVKHLTAVGVSDAQWKKFLDAHTPVPEHEGRAKTMAENKREGLEVLWRHDERVTPWKGTAFGVVQAVNTYTHHEGIVRGVDHRAERNMLRAITGGAEKLDRATVATLGRVLDRDDLTLTA